MTESSQTEMSWHEAHLIAIRQDPNSWPDYCPRCGVEDNRPHDEHDAEFHSGKPLPPLLHLDDEDGCQGYHHDCATLRMCQCDRLGRE